ncbi:MAG: AAA family ATPase [Nocardioides sp.]
MLADGERALVIANADEERVVRLAAPLREVTLRAGVPCCSTLARATSTSECRSRRSRSWSSRRTSTSSTTPSVGSDPRSTRSATPSSCPTSTPTCSASTSLAAQGRAAVRPARLRQDLIAKAVANSLAKKVAAKTGQEGKSYFLNIKRLRAAQQVRRRDGAAHPAGVPAGPGEGQSRHARSSSSTRWTPLRTRGSGVSDVENTIVPQLLSEIDGVETLENVLVIGASNREDMIDPAILRPGRLDVKIKIERPDAESARDIFTKYLIPELPLHADDVAEFGNDRQACVDGMIQATVERMYTESGGQQVPRGDLRQR